MSAVIVSSHICVFRSAPRRMSNVKPAANSIAVVIKIM